MDYRRFNNTIIARFDRGEEIGADLKEVAEKEDIKLASFTGLGAVNDFTVGVFDVIEKKFYPNHFTGVYEIASLFGTITTKDGEYYSHIHLSAGGKDGVVVGGHLIEAKISATCEIVITILDGTIERQYDEFLQTNTMKFVDD